MAKKYWTYDLTKLKKTGAQLLNKDYAQFLNYSDKYNSWFNKTHTKKVYKASMK